MDVLLEGIEASIQPCSLALVLPGIGAALLGGRRGWAVAVSFWLTAAALAWAQASILLQVGSDGGVIGVVLAIAAVTGSALIWLAGRRSGHTSRPVGSGGGSAVASGRSAATGGVFAVAGGVLIGAAAGLLWRPCVGPELGTILTAAPRDPSGQLGPLVVYLAGVLLSTAVVATLPHLDDRVAGAVRWAGTRTLALIPLIGLAVILVTSQYAEVIGALVRASSL